MLLSILLVIVLIAGTIIFILPPVQAYTTNIGVSYVGAADELPQRQEESPENIIITAYSEGTDYVERTFTVSVYYYTTTTPGTLIGTQSFTLKSSASVPRNQTEKIVSWDISAVSTGTYKFYAAITAGLPGGDENAADNTRTSLQNPSWRQRMLGVIAAGGHNVGVGTVQGSFPNIIKAGTVYGISISAFNNGYVAESPVTVTTYYNRSSAPTTFVSINVTTIPSLAAETGSQSWSVTWDTTGLPEDEYSLSSNATVVSGETITYEQFDYADQQVTVIQHDIAVLDVNAYPTGQTPGGLVTINMTVENQGAVTETFTVRMKANATEIASSPKTVTNLASGANTSVFFSWNPAGTGFYILNGSADFVAGELHERADNVYRNDDIRRRVNVPAIHNVATTFVSTNATYAKPGDQVSIFAVVQNRGDYDESFAVTPYYDSTQAATPQVAAISKRADTGEPYGQENLQFVWDTTGVPLGTYYIKVAASQVGGETILSDNNVTDGRVVFTKVYIDPASKTVDVSGMYQQRPTANTPTGVTVTNPGNAYDNNNATYASFTTNTDGTVDFHTFTVPGLTTNVAQVDLKIRYSALSVAADKFRLIQGVSPSATWDTLKDWTGAGVTTLAYSWDSRSEPNDGTWSWTDIQNINVRFEFDDQITENPTLTAYEIWANVYNTVGTKFRSSPQANDQVGVVVTNPANAYDWSNSTSATYAVSADGYFNLRNFNISAGTGTISKVDLKVRYAFSSVVDRYQIQDLVSPSTTTRTLQSYVTSDVNIPLETYVWSYRSEPNNGNWSWTDVSNIRVRFSTDLVGTANNREIRVYEIWATVYDKPFLATYNVGGVSGMSAWSARITWDPAVLDCLSGAKAGFFVGYTTSFSININHTGGYADLSETILGVGSTSGSGALASLAFKVLKAGKSHITPTISLLVNTQGQNMEHYEEFSRVKTLGFPLIGDFDGDGDIDATDISMFNQQYGKKLGDAGYNDIYDLYDDNVIDAKDLRLIGKNYW
jgi:hypothetical protein